MKKKWMKTLASFLALCVGVSSMNLTVLAEGNHANAKGTNTEATVATSTLGSGWDGITMTDVQDINGCRVTFELKGYWDGGYNAEVMLENTRDQAIQNWILGMEWNGEIASVWNAELSQRTGNGYIFKNAGWNQDIEAGKSVTFGICGQENFPGFPQKYQLIGDYVPAGEEDYAVDFRIHSMWETGFTAEMFLTNKQAETTIEDWILEFDFEGTIHEIWNGVIINHEGVHYVIQNSGHNGNIAPGQTISFGLNGEGSDAEPVNLSLQSMKANVTEEKKIAVFIDDPLLERVGASGLYKTTESCLSLTGRLAEAERVKTFYYQVLDEEGKIVLTDKLSATAKWKLENIPLQAGKNIITIIALDEDGNTVRAVVTVLREEEKCLALWIDKSAFVEGGISEECKTTEAFVKLRGTLDNPEEAEKFYLERLDLQGGVIETKSIAVAAEWETEEIELNMGCNVFGVVARSGSGKEMRERLVIVRRDQFDSEQPLDRDDNDEDGLPNYYEEWLGTDPENGDTDRDGLSDYDEIMFIGTNPNAPDSDHNGIGDAEADEDEDGLSNLQEIMLFTDPLSKDTDKDGILDGDEVNVFFTDPLNKDSDGDEVLDGQEVEWGTDPNSFDTSFSVCVTAQEEDEVIVSVEATLPGGQAGSLAVRKDDWAYYIPEGASEYVGGAYDFTVRGEIQQATIKFEFSEELLNDPNFDPVICYFNQDTQQLELVETVVEGNVASARVEHFSIYMLLFNRAYYKLYYETIVLMDVDQFYGYAESEVVIVIEDSASMKRRDPNYQRLQVAKDLIDKMPDSCKMGIVRCADTAESYTTELTTDKELLKSFLTLDNFKSQGTGGYFKGQGLAISMLDLENHDMEKHVVFLSDDGALDWEEKSVGTIFFWDNNIKKDVCLFIPPYDSGDINEYDDWIWKIASETVHLAETFRSGSVEEFIQEIYQDVYFQLDDKTDTDGDGLPDFYEDNITSYGNKPIKLYKDNEDSDDDGLWDGEEVTDCSYFLSDDKTKITIIAHFVCNPGDVDTDVDGLSDLEELYLWGTRPKDPDTDKDGMKDGLETFVGFDPLDPDADKDGRLDRQEWDEGTSPYVYDKSLKEYTENFLKGFVAGDFIQDAEDFPMLAGQIISSCIPFVDARDVAGNLYHGNLLMAGMSMVGFLPYAGDAAKAVSKCTKFLLKNLDNASEVAKLFELLSKNFPDIVKELSKSDEFMEAIQKLLAKADLSKMTKKEGKILEEFFASIGIPKDLLKLKKHSAIIEELDRFLPNKINHIINGSKNSNHAWEKLVPNKEWESIKKIIIEVMDVGTEVPYKSVFSKTAIINGYKVKVIFNKLEDDIIKIADAWVIVP